MLNTVTIKFLTCAVVSLWLGVVFSAIVEQKDYKTHLRWSIFVPKDHVVINKTKDKVTIKTLDVALYEKLKKGLSNLKMNGKYFTEIKFVNGGDKNSVSTILVPLISENVELFSFYRQKDHKYIVDFWIDQDAANLSAKAVTKKVAKKVAKGKNFKNQALSKSTPKLLKKPVERKTKKVFSTKSKRIKMRELAFKDFRYGAAFVWDVPALSPQLKPSINIQRKTPEYLYPVKDRDFEKSDREAHLQLSINLYRKKKWGLMYKSIKLFQQKYGENSNIDLNEYLKANAILRTNLQKGKSGPAKMANNIFVNIAERTKIYDLKKAALKYLIEYSIQHKEFIHALQWSKKLYVASKENYEYEETASSAEIILHSLSKLNQVDRVNKLIEEKTIKKILSKQTIMAYKIFVNLNLGKVEVVTKYYEKMKRSLKKPIKSSILYNVAESYFRQGKFRQSIVVYDDFIAQHSYHTYASQARLRLALSYEILGKDPSQTLELYKNCINRSQNKEVSYEARIRYTALRSVRKNNINEKDREIRVFLDRDSMDIKKISRNLKKLLWLVRLRTFIVDKKYKEALRYLKALPVTSLKPSERRVFSGDGAEITYGMIVANYDNSEFSRVVQRWELYKNKYVDKVANDPYMNYIVGRSYIKLGLYDGFDRVYATFAKLNSSPQRTFPLWVKRNKFVENEEVLFELQVVKNIKLEKWRNSRKYLKMLKGVKPAYSKINFYEGIISFKQNKHGEAIKYFERYLSHQNEKAQDPTEIADMLRYYTDAIYETGQLDKYKQVSKAILSDTRNFAVSNVYMQKVLERVSYMSIEILAGEDSASSFLLLEGKIKAFKKKFKNSTYKGRINYLLAVSLIANKKPGEGKEILNSLLQEKDVDEYVRALARSELSLLEIKRKTTI